jgi:hypothetical protein
VNSSVSTPRAQGDMLRKPRRVSSSRIVGGGDHHPARRPVEPAHVAVARRHRQDGRAGRDILGKARVVAGGEGQPPLHADAPRRQADGPLGGDVDGLGLEVLEHLLHGAVGAQRQLDLRIGRQGRRLEQAGVDHLHRMVHGPALGDGARQRPHHAVDLRLPGVRREQDAHGGPIKRGERRG